MPPWSKAFGGGPGMPAQPIHEPCPACTIGASALTRPPGLTSQEPSSARTTGRRFATMTISSDGWPRAHSATVAPPPPRRARAGCLCVTPCGSVPPMSAQRILASGAAALLVLIVLAIVFHDDDSGADSGIDDDAADGPGRRAARARRGRATSRSTGPCKDADEKSTIEAAASRALRLRQRRSAGCRCSPPPIPRPGSPTSCRRSRARATASARSTSPSRRRP